MQLSSSGYWTPVFPLSLDLCLSGRPACCHRHVELLKCFNNNSDSESLTLSDLTALKYLLTPIPLTTLTCCVVWAQLWEVLGCHAIICMGGCYSQIYFLTIYHVTFDMWYLKLAFKDVLLLKRKSHWQLNSWSKQIVNKQERVKRKHKLLGCTEISLMYGFLEFQEKAWAL